MPDLGEHYGQLFHEHGRLTVNAEREKPFGVQPWKDRTDEQREIDMRGASAVAAEARRDVEAELIRLRKFRMAVTVCLPVALGALRVAPDSTEAGFPAWRYEAAREALVGILGPDKSNEKGT